MSDTPAAVHPYTVRLELVDRPGELLRALAPIAEHGGNLRSIFHERGDVTPRGNIPVEVDLEASPDRFEAIVDAIREEGITVIQAGAERYSEEITVLLVGHLVGTDLSETLSRIQNATAASVRDFALAAPDGADSEASARLRIATRAEQTEDVLAGIRQVATEKNLRLVEPLTAGAGAGGAP